MQKRLLSLAVLIGVVFFPAAYAAETGRYQAIALDGDATARTGRTGSGWRAAPARQRCLAVLRVMRCGALPVACHGW